ncbi:hypothetical protein JL721_5575 [Aureococcus anophagefferens]|nr:hypothetical protein JL721_5575 [Aureococcus anophagefferens]
MAAARGDDASVEALLAFGDRRAPAEPASGRLPARRRAGDAAGRSDDAGCDYLVRAASDGDDREPAARRAAAGKRTRRS